MGDWARRRTRILTGSSPASELQVLPQPFRLGAADRDLRRLRVPHPQDEIPAEPGDYLLDLVDVDEVRAMHAPEHRLVQLRLQFVEGPVRGHPRHLTGYDRD